MLSVEASGIMSANIYASSHAIIISLSLCTASGEMKIYTAPQVTCIKLFNGYCVNYSRESVLNWLT